MLSNPAGNQAVPAFSIAAGLSAPGFGYHRRASSSADVEKTGEPFPAALAGMERQ
jgi:hypothetical protein